MKCPHCLKEIHAEFGAAKPLSDGKRAGFEVKERLGGGNLLLLEHYTKTCRCPSCEKLITYLIQEEYVVDYEMRPLTVRETNGSLIVPKSSIRYVSPTVPNEYKEDYEEAALILQDSPKASAALSRRCLQSIIRNEAKIHEKTLYDEIEKLKNSGTLPSNTSDVLDAVRHFGNFAAHPSENQNTGEIIKVEPHEAEWMLDILDSLFDFYLFDPLKIKQKKMN